MQKSLPLELRERNKEWIRWTYLCRVATPQMFQVVTGGYLDWITKRCRGMERAGYFARPATLSRRRPIEPICYGLGNEGVRYLTRDDPNYKDKTIRAKDVVERRNRAWKVLTLEHQLSVASIMTCLRVACERAGLELHWRGQPDIGNRPIRHVGQEGTRWPDAFFAIRVPNLPEGKRSANFFLEVDRKTEPKWIRQRSEDYFEWWQNRLNDRRFHRRRTWAWFTNFRVLNVAINKERMVALQHAARDVGRDRDHPTGWPGLLFTYEDAIDLGDPASILRPIFFRQTPNSEPLSIVPAKADQGRIPAAGLDAPSGPEYDAGTTCPASALPITDPNAQQDHPVDVPPSVSRRLFRTWTVAGVVGQRDRLPAGPVAKHILCDR